MSESDDDMPLIARRRPVGDAAPTAAAKPTEAEPANNGDVRADKAAPTTQPKHVDGVKQAKQASCNHPDVGKPAAAEPPPVKQEAAESSDDDEDDIPIAARGKPPAGAGAKAVAAVKAEPADSKRDSTGKQQQKQSGDVAKKPAAASSAATKRRSSDGGTAPNSKKQKEQQPQIKKEQDGKQSGQRTAAMKPPAGKAGANGAVKQGPAVKKESKQPVVKKKFELPGQTRETPDETDPLRKFYTSLLQERPESAMAKKWCVQCGLLPEDEAADWVRQSKGGKGAASTPVKAAKRPAAPTRKPAAKKIAVSDDDDDEEDDKPKSKPKPRARAAAAKPSSRLAKKEKLEFLEDDDDSSDDDVPLAKRKAPAKA